jgi:hypothetical protein
MGPGFLLSIVHWRFLVLSIMLVMFSERFQDVSNKFEMPEWPKGALYNHPDFSHVFILTTLQETSNT